jgi:predicted permease
MSLVTKGGSSVVGAFQGFVVISVPIVIGYVLARLGALGPQAAHVLNQLAFLVLMPLLMFTILASADVPQLLGRLLPISAATAGVVFALYLAIACGWWRRGLGQGVVGALAAGYVNANNVGLPLAQHMLGDGTLVAPIVLMQLVVFAPTAMLVLAISSGRRDKPLWRVALGAVCSPLVLCCVAGVAVALWHVRLPDLVAQPVAMIGGAAVSVMLMGFGVSMHGRPLLSRGTPRRDVVLASVFKVVTMPLAAWLLGRFAFGLAGRDLLAVVLLGALPTAQNVFNYAYQYGVSVSLARDTVAITTLASPLAILVIAALLA